MQPENKGITEMVRNLNIRIEKILAAQQAAKTSTLRFKEQQLASAKAMDNIDRATFEIRWKALKQQLLKERQ